MLHKILQVGWRRGPPALLRPMVRPEPVKVQVMRAGDYVPPTQYDTPIPKRLHFFYVIRVYWETIPIFVTTGAAIMFAVIATIWACKNKVDVVFSTHSRDNISRTMDLYNPSIHKMITINQRYEPWPEMQMALDKMEAAERRAAMRAKSCTYP